MFDVQHKVVGTINRWTDEQSVAEFTITGKESGESYSGTFTAGSAHDMTNEEKVSELILASTSWDWGLLDQAADSSLKSIVIYLMEEGLCDNVEDAFNAGEQLVKLGQWILKLTAGERIFLDNAGEN